MTPGLALCVGVFIQHIHSSVLTCLVVCWASSFSSRVFRSSPVPLAVCQSGDSECGLKIARVSALLFSWCYSETSLPAFVSATRCRADLLLKAEMLAGCTLCIIDADCDWALRAIGYNFKNQKVEWTRAELAGYLAGDSDDGGCSNHELRDDLILATWRVYWYIFNETGSQSETGMIKFGSWVGIVEDSVP